jgi:chromatin structure-remodeling complex subunit RSC1/2
MADLRSAGLFVDHALEDVIEKIACQFTARHIRGRPRPPFWYPAWPLYVCHSRYNDRERLFVKIKNWSSCVPEEVRKNEDFMPIYPFERLVYPPKAGSPFVGTNPAKGPGGIGEPIERAQGEKIEGGGTGRKRAKRNVDSEATTNTGVDRSTPAPVTSTAAYLQYTSVQQSPAKSHTQEDARDRTMLAAAGTLTVPPIVDKLPPETSGCLVVIL